MYCDIPKLCWHGRPSDWNCITGNVWQRDRERARDCNVFLYYNILVNETNADVVMSITLFYPPPPKKKISIKNLFGFQCYVSDSILIWIFWTLSNVPVTPCDSDSRTWTPPVCGALGNYIYTAADKSLARPTSRCILFDGETISFDASLDIYILQIFLQLWL